MHLSIGPSPIRDIIQQPTTTSRKPLPPCTITVMQMQASPTTLLDHSLTQFVHGNIMFAWLCL